MAEEVIRSHLDGLTDRNGQIDSSNDSEIVSESDSKSVGIIKDTLGPHVHAVHYCSIVRIIYLCLKYKVLVPAYIYIYAFSTAVLHNTVYLFISHR